MVKTILKTLGVCAVAFAVVCGITGCSSGKSGVAVTINGDKILEEAITKKVEQIRARYELTDTNAWGRWLVKNKLTPEKVRDQMIDSYISQHVIKAGAKELGVEVSSEEIDKRIQDMRSKYDSDDAWNKALEQAGFTAEEYHDTVESSLLSQKIQEKLREDTKVEDADVLKSCNMYASFLTGARKSSHILFEEKDEATAKDVLKKINAGKLDFAEAAKQYSTDKGSAAQGGNVGWDKMNNFVPEYTKALSDLKKGQVSALVKSKFGYHIIKCTDEWTAPKEITELNQMPQEMVDSIKKMTLANKTQQAFKEWLDAQKDKADVKKNDMPKGLSYDLDITKYEQEAQKAQEQKAAEQAQKKNDDAAKPADGAASSADKKADDKKADAPNPADGKKPADAKK